MGERVAVSYDERTVPGQVVLASPNGKSLALAFEALLGGYAGMMPVLWNEETATFEDLIEHRPVELAGEQRPALASLPAGSPSRRHPEGH